MTSTTISTGLYSTLISGSDTLEKYAHWLSSIPRDDMDKLRSSVAYGSFSRAFKDLQREHQYIRQQEVAQRQKHTQDHHIFIYSLQHITEELILRIFEHLQTSSLAKVMQTCHRFHILGEKSAKQRTMNFVSDRVLESNMKVLRAQEQYLGIGSTVQPFVKLPILGLSMRVRVSDVTDTEYNGLYFCTGCNGNGYVFTKPRFSMCQSEEVININSKSLLCRIAKRFSGENILWYMSKEVFDPLSGTKRELFQYWSNLMHAGDTTPDLCRYPSQTSALLRQPGGFGWQPLENTSLLDQPTVEVMNHDAMNPYPSTYGWLSDIDMMI